MTARPLPWPCPPGIALVSRIAQRPFAGRAGGGFGRVRHPLVAELRKALELTLSCWRALGAPRWHARA